MPLLNIYVCVFLYFHASTALQFIKFDSEKLPKILLNIKALIGAARTLIGSVNHKLQIHKHGMGLTTTLLQVCTYIKRQY